MGNAEAIFVALEEKIVSLEEIFLSLGVYLMFPRRAHTPIHLPTSIKSPKQSKKVLKNKIIIIQKANEEYMTNGIKLAQ